MKISKNELTEFITPYYCDKDIMHNMWHIELVRNKIDDILEKSSYTINYEYLMLAMCFHGFIYSDEERIREWLLEHNYNTTDIDMIVKIAWESQRTEIPETIEGKILHDAHILEGGKTYTVVKTLITGSVRGQTLKETLDFMQKNVLNKGKCYLPETQLMCDEMNKYTNQFYTDIISEIK